MPFRNAVLRVFPNMAERLGIEIFEAATVELEMTAHCDADYFAPHRDSFVAAERLGQKTERVITAGYYFHAPRRRFTGGEFAIYPVGPGEPLLIDPVNNRLLAVPAFALHEVRKISIADTAFCSARFAVNAWIHRRVGRGDRGGCQ